MNVFGLSAMNTASVSLRYHGVAVALHWVLAIALAGLFFMGHYMADLPFSPQRLKLYNWHKWAGVSILILSAVRLGWRLVRRPPALPQAVTLGMPAWQIQAYHATHIAMYALFFIVPLLGWAYSSAAGFSIVLFGTLPLPDFVSASKPLAEVIKPWHELSANALAALVVLHIGAAIKHQVVDKDGLMDRMRFGRP
jgi:cytochrome b561